MKRIQWRAIPFLPNGYEVSNTGLVRSLPRKYVSDYRILKPKSFGKYQKVYLSFPGKKSQWFAVHRLVAMTFLENPDHLPQIDHIDENPENNHVDNLSWISASDNICKAMNVRIRCWDKQNGTSTYYDSQVKCAEDIGLHHSLVSKIVHGKFHKRYTIEKL